MSEDSNAEKKLFANKFETVEQLEEGYNNAAKVYQENEKLRKQLDEWKTPDEYFKPSNMAIDDKEFDDIRIIAKNANLNQQQFEKLAIETHARNQRRIRDYEEKSKAIGEENLNVLKDYVAKAFPAEMAETALQKIVTDEHARAAAYRHREKLLSSVVPGIGQGSEGNGINPIKWDDVVAARDAHLKAPGNMRLRDEYLRINTAYGVTAKK